MPSPTPKRFDKRSSQGIVLVAPTRTPIGKFGGGLASLTAAQLGTAAARACLERSGCPPDRVDQAVFGHGRQAGGGPNTARQISVKAGIPEDRPAFTINQACASGLQAVFCAARSILLGEAQVVLAGGTESMSNTPYLLPRARWGHRLGHGELTDGMYRDGFDDPLSERVMGETAEELADQEDISRSEADAWAVESQHRCQKARQAHLFEAEISPVTVPHRRGDKIVSLDEHPREGVTAESLGRLKPVFRQQGTVTAGNASGITDGAAALLVASEEAATELGLEPIARLIDWSVVGVEPRIMGIGPVPAVEALRERHSLTWDDVDQIELNEAFASQVLACLKHWDCDSKKVNPDGGAIALGHPIGCTGARLLVTLTHALARRGGGRGLATLCVSGGMGVAALVET
ncbi:MAG: thiolase family protein [Deltaproteobacteria bacterium]|nr:thiolase family protein [Deltaproteobacteria bacterium]